MRAKLPERRLNRIRGPFGECDNGTSPLVVVERRKILSSVAGSPSKITQ